MTLEQTEPGMQEIKPASFMSLIATLKPVSTSRLSTFPSQLIDMLPVVVVHGGAGHIPKERSELSTSGVTSAVRAG